jgi:hypothetical protein
MQPQYSRDSYQTLALSITITACEMVTFRRLLTKWLEGAATIKIKNRARTRHIEVHHHYVRDKVEDGTIRLDYLNTKDMLADMLTKPLQALTSLRNQIQQGQDTRGYPLIRQTS